jgi:uncharacterized protein
MYHHRMAQTPWGEVAVSDAHVHFFSHRFYSALAAQKKMASAEALRPLLGWDIPESDPEALGNRWVQELDRRHVGKACLIASVPGDEASVCAAVQVDPARLFGYFMLNPLAEDAAARMAAAGKQRSLHCVCLFPAMHGYSVADGRVQPVLDIAAESGLAVFVHCGALSVGVRRKLGLQSLFDMRYSNPLDLHPVALRYPQIQFVVPHFGAGLFREALMLADLCPNIWMDTSSSNHWTLYEGLTLAEVFRRTLAVMGPSRLLFGTDSSFFPRGWHAAVFQEQVAAMREAGVNQEQAQQILGGNLEQFHSGRLRHFSGPQVIG